METKNTQVFCRGFLLLSAFGIGIGFMETGNHSTIKYDFVSDPDENKATIGSVQNYENIFPTVNKCCPFFSRYENGKCIKVGNSSVFGDGQDDPYWPASKPIVTFAKDLQGLNMTDNYGDPVIFRLRVSMPNCAAARIETIVLSEIMPVSDTTDSNTSVALSPEGYLLWSDLSYVHQISYQDFCVDQVSSTTNVAVLCKPTCDETRPCVRKCCSPEQVLYNNTCIHSTKKWQPHLYKSQGERIKDDSTIQPHYKIGLPKCSDTYIIQMRDEPSENVYLLLNGSIILVHANGKRSVFDMDSFCLDGSGIFTEAFNGENFDYPDFFELTHFSGNERDQTVVLCYPDNSSDEEPEAWRLMLYGCVALMSSFFLFLTALVYLILWEYQNIHGWLQFCYVVSLLFAFTFLAFVQLSSKSIQGVSTICCEVIGSLIHFLFLSAFFWLTSMNFDLWWTFSGCRPLRTNSSTGEKKRFLCFGLFSWGFPSLIAGTGLVLDSLFRDNPYIITPRFGDRFCYFFGDKEKLPYFYGPVGFLLTINSIFFISTIYSLYKLQNDTKFATRQSSKQEKKRFLLFMKLFVVMGVLWIFEVISWATAMLNPQEARLIKNFFLPTDILNTAQGIAIFIIFTCKPNTCRQLDSQFKKFSVYLEEKRVRISTSNTSAMKTGLISGLCTVVIPIINRLRELLIFCGKVTRSLEGRRNMSHTNTITSTWDKSRKASDCSASTVNSHLDPGSIELDLAHNPHFYIRSNSTINV